ncbi:MAG: DNA recombination protein RmuC, partial [Rikenella sp.]|nr:DNA recombination protein RmuC [Rikenella sp.]
MEIVWIVLLAATTSVAVVLYLSERASARRSAGEAEAQRAAAEQWQNSWQELQARSVEQRAAAERELVVARAEGERRLAEAQAEIRVWTERFENQTVEREKLQKQFSDHFRNLANDILEEKTRRFTDTNQKNIGELLKPLGERLDRFRQRIEQEAADRKVLEAEIRRLHEMSNQVSREANNLAAALRGNSK